MHIFRSIYVFSLLVLLCLYLPYSNDYCGYIERADILGSILPTTLESDFPHKFWSKTFFV